MFISFTTSLTAKPIYVLRIIGNVLCLRLKTNTEEIRRSTEIHLGFSMELCESSPTEAQAKVGLCGTLCKFFEALLTLCLSAACLPVVLYFTISVTNY